MTIWIDADACPVSVREMVLRASDRTQTALVFVANSPLPVKRTALVKTIQGTAWRRWPYAPGQQLQNCSLRPYARMIKYIEEETFTTVSSPFYVCVTVGAVWPNLASPYVV